MKAISPNMARAGFVPASAHKGWRCSNMLRPKLANPKPATPLASCKERLAGEVLNHLMKSGHVFAFWLIQ